MKKIILIVAIATLILCGTACAERSDSDSNLSGSQSQNSTEEMVSSTDPAPESKPDSSDSAAAENPVSKPQTSLDGLEDELNGYEFAVAYVGYTEKAQNADINSVRECAAKSSVAAKYPFIADISNDRIILAGGGEIYCVIPAKTDAKVTVNSLNRDENGAEIIADELFSGGSAPILISCNVSDIMPNTAVSITDGDKTLRFSPFISLRDGRLDLPENLKILDFSEYGF